MKKICSKCGVEKEVEEFRRWKHSQDGYVDHCKKCANRRSPKPGSVMVRADGCVVKKCAKCDVEKPISEFNFRHSRGQKVPRSRCRNCESVDRREKYLSDPDKYRQISRVYRAHNPEKVRHSRREWALRFPDKVSALKKRYWEKNRDVVIARRKATRDPVKYRAAIKRWEENNKDKVRLSSLRWAKKQSDTLSDTYIICALRSCKITNPSPELIELKREQLMLYRMTKELFKALNEVSDESNRVDEGTVGDEPDK